MKNKVLKQLYIPKCKVEEFRGKIEKLNVSLNGTDKIEYGTDLSKYKYEEVIIFYTTCYGDTVEEAEQECDKFKVLIKESFGVEAQEK